MRAEIINENLENYDFLILIYESCRAVRLLPSFVSNPWKFKFNIFNRYREDSRTNRSCRHHYNINISKMVTTLIKLNKQIITKSVSTISENLMRIGRVVFTKSRAQNLMEQKWRISHRTKKRKILIRNNKKTKRSSTWNDFSSHMFIENTKHLFLFCIYENIFSLFLH